MKTHPGKGLTEAALREARERAWAAFMDDARQVAAVRGERVQVVGVPSTEYRIGWTDGKQRWTYVIEGER